MKYRSLLALQTGDEVKAMMEIFSLILAQRLDDSNRVVVQRKVLAALLDISDYDFAVNMERLYANGLIDYTNIDDEAVIYLLPMASLA